MIRYADLLKILDQIQADDMLLLVDHEGVTIRACRNERILTHRIDRRKLETAHCEDVIWNAATANMNWELST